ncbi:MAG: hypothetical protein MK134_04620 [Dehalococcoidia bacterium]|nr:hypothetical protein [Dehalococcoidia bacterium]
MLFVDQVHDENARQTSPLQDVRIWGTRGMANIDLLASTVREFGLGAANIGLEFGQFRRPLTNAVGNAAGIYIGHGIGFSVHELPTIQQKT